MKRSRILVTAGAAAFALSLSACGSDDPTGGTPDATPGTTEESPMATPSDEMTDDMTMEDAALVGPGCADYAAQVPEGDGSVEGMAQDPVATAASNNPLLTTLTAAVSGELNPDVNLVDDLNGAEGITVFAPVDDAFAALDQETLDLLASPEGAETLTQVLTYHVATTTVDSTTPEGDYDTLEGGTVTVSGTGDDIMVNADSDNPASVICGGVQTANATVYLIDAVLMPPADS
ncbi:fasciclin domain-containing protein [Pseudokineococcus sp. 1T1Z-3]|uniref:fasciclin domain-containing protein n=1 Tax=Pseudokineococcus sp. 1T1Z-3 TaxID=3132745 RepID=UPI0030AB2874